MPITTTKKPCQPLRSLSFCINYSPNTSRHAINHIIYAIPKEFLPFFLYNLYYFPLIVGVPFSEPRICSPPQHSPHILNRIQFWRAGRLRHFQVLWETDESGAVFWFWCGIRKFMRRARCFWLW